VIVWTKVLKAVATVVLLKKVSDVHLIQVLLYFIFADEGVNRTNAVETGVILYLYIEVIEAVKSHVIGALCSAAEMYALLPGDQGFRIQIELVEQVDLHNKHLVVA
jgi:hypothetical protein